MVRKRKAGKISIHPPHTGRDAAVRDLAFSCAVIISIHPPHTGRDFKDRRLLPVHVISIHPPHTGRDSVETLIYL